MSNEPKWTVVEQSIDCYIVTNKQINYAFMWDGDANDLCDTLNSLEAEVERLQSDLARCKAERLGSVQSELYQNNILRSYPEEMHSYRKTQEGKG